MTTRKTKKPPENPPPPIWSSPLRRRHGQPRSTRATPCIHLRGYFNADRAYQAVKQTDPMSQRVHVPGTPEYRALCKEWNPRFTPPMPPGKRPKNVARRGDQCAVLAEAWT